jgi:hypothetical protein
MRSGGFSPVDHTNMTRSPKRFNVHPKLLIGNAFRVGRVDSRFANPAPEHSLKRPALAVHDPYQHLVGSKPVAIGAVRRPVDALRNPKPAAAAARPTLEGLSKLPDPVGPKVPFNAETVARAQRDSRQRWGAYVLE